MSFATVQLQLLLLPDHVDGLTQQSCKASLCMYVLPTLRPFRKLAGISSCSPWPGGFRNELLLLKPSDLGILCSSCDPPCLSLPRLLSTLLLLLGIVMFSCFENIHWQVELFSCLSSEFANGLFKWALPVALIWGDGGQWNLECPAYHVDGLPQPSCWSARSPLCRQRCPGS